MVDRLRSRRDEIAQAIYARIQQAVPDTGGGRDAAYQAGMLAAVTAVLDYCLRAIEHGPAWSEPIPVEAAAQARRATRAGVSVGAVLRRYVAGHHRLGEFIAEETTRLGFSNNEPALHHIRKTQQELLEHLTAAIEHEYDQERQRIARSPEQRRVELVQRLLDGEPVTRTELAELGYKFDAWHVGMIATGPRATEALEILRADDHQLLQVWNSEETVWFWLGGQRKLTHADMERLRLSSELAGVSLAVGEPVRGVEGWRETHQQAQEALQVVLLGRQKRARYADIAVLTPWLQDPDRARSLIELYLSPLESQKDGGAVSRQALRAYFEAGRIVSAAACQLGIDRRTLAYRLSATEECLGYQLDTHLAGLWVALRLHDLLNGQDCTNWKTSAPPISTLA